MDKLQSAIDTLHDVDHSANQRNGKSHINPLARLLVSFLYILTVVSFSKYDVIGLLGMAVYIVILGILEELSLVEGFRRTRYMLLLVALLGAVNPFFDKTIITYIGAFALTGGMLSFLTLFLKGVLTVYGAYFLIMTTGIEEICRALRLLHIPRGGVTVVLLIYRYIIVLLKEVQKMQQAYKLRAPRQKGVHIRAWGPFAGLLLLRSMDRAQVVYESMCLRGYKGEFYVGGKGKESRAASVLYVAGWGLVFFVLRFVPVFQVIGNWFVG